MKKICILQFLFYTLFSFGQETKLYLGQKIKQNQLFPTVSSGILVNSSQFLPKKDTILNNIRYTYATTEEDIVVFVLVKDKNFEINGEKWIGKRVKQIKELYPVKKMPGWGFFIKIDEFWLGLLNTNVQNKTATYTDEDQVIAVFQSQRAMDYFK